MTSLSTQLFTRNRLTWLTYIMLAYVAFVQSILGPLMPVLRGEFKLNYTQGGMLPAALAVGLIFSGLTSDWLVRHSSRRQVFWGGSLGLTLGVVMLGLSHQFTLAFIAVLGMGIGSTLTQVMIQALLSDQHGEQRAIAFAEANVAASFSTTLTPFVIGSLQRANLDWRLIAILALFFLLLLVFSFYRDLIPEASTTLMNPSTNFSKAGLPLSYWLYWIVLFLVVAIEMTLAVWATDFLANAARLGRTNAALAFGAFPAAMLTGRFFGSRLTRRWSSHQLLIAALAITLMGFPLFWLSHLVWLNILGLFITGLGIANLYPLTLSLAVGLAAQQSNLASARAALGVGVALLSAPLVLGWLADRIGIQSAFGIVIGLVLTALAVVVFNNRWLLARQK